MILLHHRAAVDALRCRHPPSGRRPNIQKNNNTDKGSSQIPPAQGVCAYIAGSRPGTVSLQPSKRIYAYIAGCLERIWSARPYAAKISSRRTCVAKISSERTYAEKTCPGSTAPRGKNKGRMEIQPFLTIACHMKKREVVDGFEPP
jgi:hypothetical protein